MKHRFYSVAALCMILCLWGFIRPSVFSGVRTLGTNPQKAMTLTSPAFHDHAVMHTHFTTK